MNALTLISIRMFVGIGMANIFVMMGVINLAHEGFMTLRAFTLVYIQGIGSIYWIALVLVPFVGILFVLFLEDLITRYLYT